MSLYRTISTLALAILSLPATAAGWVEGVNLVGTDFRVWGWGCDRAVPNQPVWLHIWRDDNVFLGAAPADLYRESAVGTACGGNSQHGFYAKLTLPQNILDWKNHAVYVYVVGPSGSEKLSPTQSIVFTGMDNVSKPRSPGDVVGRDYFGTYAGHLGIWDGEYVYQMTGVKTGSLPTMSREAIESFNIQSRPWGAVTPKFPQNLSVKKCFARACNTNNDRRTLTAAVAIANRAFQIYLIGADYTASAHSNPSREGKNTAGDIWPPMRGMYRCDTYVMNSYAVLSPWSMWEDLFSREVLNSPTDWRTRMSNFINRPYLPSLVFDAIKASFP